MFGTEDPGGCSPVGALDRFVSDTDNPGIVPQFYDAGKIQGRWHTLCSDPTGARGIGLRSRCRLREDRTNLSG